LAICDDQDGINNRIVFFFKLSFIKVILKTNANQFLL